jgi:hypothetical protein
LVWEKSKFKHDNIVFINAPKKPNGSRPTTHDTVDAWIATNPKPGSCLSISSQPFVYYQEITMKNALEKHPDFGIEGVGFDYDDPDYFKNNIGAYLDNLARTIFTLVQMKENSFR